MTRTWDPGFRLARLVLFGLYLMFSGAFGRTKQERMWVAGCERGAPAAGDITHSHWESVKSSKQQQEC